MPHFRAYVDKKFGQASLDLIGRANDIITEYQGQGFSLTLRQLYYQFVARGLLDNNDKNYKRLGEIISDGRLAGLVSWTAIEDRTRNLMGITTTNGPRKAIEAAASAYHTDLWRSQPWRPEVWIEKEALVGVVGGICDRLRVDFFACRGYNSQSEQWRAGRRFAGYISKGQRPIVFHLGDHDPSGLDMTRDNRDRLGMFAGTPVIVQRLALNMAQIKEVNPPPNPAKITDARFQGYRHQYGVDESWELDALDPTYITRLIDQAVHHIRDPELWDKALSQETEDKRVLQEIAEGFER